MRQGQQNRRGRGRSRKPQNPLARNFESNGPDVKIRGTASHIAEKYMSLARDALASGDSVTAESYLQHAEHYNRIIMAAHSQGAPGQQTGDQQQANGNAGRGRQGGSDAGDGDADLGAEAAASEGSAAPSESRGRGRGRQRRNGSHAAAEAQAEAEAPGGPEANGGAEANSAADVSGATESNGADQPADATASKETEGASGAVS